MANIPNISSLHEFNEISNSVVPQKEDEDITLTEVEDAPVENNAWAFGLRDLHNGRIETENKLAVLSDQ